MKVKERKKNTRMFKASVTTAEVSQEVVLCIQRRVIMSWIIHIITSTSIENSNYFIIQFTLLWLWFYFHDFSGLFFYKPFFNDNFIVPLQSQ